MKPLRCYVGHHVFTDWYTARPPEVATRVCQRKRCRRIEAGVSDALVRAWTWDHAPFHVPRGWHWRNRSANIK